jgi:hypothetical protein
MENKFKHAKEPWIAQGSYIKDCNERFIVIEPIDTTIEEDVINVDRIVDCVNAMAGIEQPEQFVKNSLQNALRMLELQAENEKMKESLAKIYTCDVSVCENQYEIIHKLREIADKALKE